MIHLRKNLTNIEIGSVKPHFILVVIEVNKIKPMEDSIIKARQKGEEERQERCWFSTLHQQGEDEGSGKTTYLNEKGIRSDEDSIFNTIQILYNRNKGR